MDAHFAHSMNVVTSWCKEKNNCITSTQLVTALQSKYRLRNTLVQLLKHDRPQLQLLESVLQKVDNKLKKAIKRCNDVIFQYPDSAGCVMNSTISLNEKIKNIPPFNITSFLHSGIGNGTKVTINLSNDYVSMDSSSVTATYDEESDQEDGNHVGDKEKCDEEEEEERDEKEAEESGEEEEGENEESFDSDSNSSSSNEEDTIDMSCSDAIPNTGVITGVKISSDFSIRR